MHGRGDPPFFKSSEFIVMRIVISFTGAACLLVVLLNACSEARSPAPAPEANLVSSPSTRSDSIEGFWKTVYFEEAGQVRTHNQVKAFHQGKFMLVNQDSTGQLAYAAHGTYEIQGGVYKETFLFFSNGSFAGWSDWQEWSMSGDTLVMKGYIRVQKNDNSDDTKNWKPFVEKRVKLP